PLSQSTNAAAFAPAIFITSFKVWSKFVAILFYFLTKFILWVLNHRNFTFKWVSRFI
ncbi:MAG: hypothetical protein ACI9EW_003903, partial [Cellvibrionaceae bacterium]